MAAATISIASPRDASDHADIRALFVEYAASLGFSLAYQGFDAELAQLPGEYAPPAGALLLARAGDAAAGVVALRRLEPAVCEMKRLYVPPTYRGLRTPAGLSIGRALTVAIIDQARALGYLRVRLDTIAGAMDAAIRLYRSLGFAIIAPYYPSPIPDSVFMELQLTR